MRYRITFDDPKQLFALVESLTGATLDPGVIPPPAAGGLIFP